MNFPTGIPACSRGLAFYFRELFGMPLIPPSTLELLESRAEDADRNSEWPADSWNALRSAGPLAWSIPVEYGGLGLGPVERLQGMEQLASRCLTVTFALSQREAAVRQLLKGPEHLRSRYLPPLASGEAFLTVGLSQLTTSRQHLGPSLRAASLPSGGYRLNGEIPWVTGADQAHALIAGATLDDGRQLLLVIPRDRLLDAVDPPLPLSSLVGSRTSLVHCRNVLLDADSLLLPPTENVLGKIGGGGLDTSCLGIGLASGAVQYIRSEVPRRPDLEPIALRFESALRDVRHRLHALAVTEADPVETLNLRLDCTRLALRSTQAALMIAKGVGFVAPHPVQRWSRQALFFLVWSCPRPVAEGLLVELAAW